MTYHGIVKLTKQKFYLLFAANIALLCQSVLFFFGMLNWQLPVGLLALTALLYGDIVMCERKSSATLSASVFNLNRAYVYGIIVIKRTYRFQYAHENQSSIDEITRCEAETFSSDTINEIAYADITFFRQSAVFSQNTH